MDVQAQVPDDYSGSLFLRCPPSLPQAIRQAARSHMTTSASYVRGAILRQLQIDGYLYRYGAKLPLRSNIQGMLLATTIRIDFRQKAAARSQDTRTPTPSRS
jgi:hypothetical protein